MFWRNTRVACVVAAALLVAVPGVAGDQVTVQEAATVARSWLGLQQELGVVPAEYHVGSVDTLLADGVLVGFVCDLTPTGYLLIPSRFELSPVKAYSLSHPFSREQGELGFFVTLELRSVLAALPDHLAAWKGVDPDTAPGAANRMLWQRLLAGSVTPSAREKSTMTTVGPFVTARWGQGAPYNLFCPDACGEKTIAGCVAIATAQIMHFWKHPAHGYGSHAFLWDGDDCGSEILTASFDDPYNWAQMPPSIARDGPSAQREAGAELCYEVAVAYESAFGRYGTGAWVGRAAEILPGFFGYNPAINIQYRADYGSDDQWFAIFRQQLDLGRPVLMALRGYHESAPTEILQHAAVADGYRVQDGQPNLLHLNLGWGHSYDDWYALDNIFTGGCCHWDIPIGQFCVRDIFPDPCTGLPAPQSPAADVSEVSGDTPYTISWQKVPSAIRYELAEATDPSFVDASTTMVGQTSLALSHQVRSESEFHYRVRTIAACGTDGLASEWSETVTVKVLPDPGTVSDTLHYLVPGVAHIAGVGGSSWRTDLAALNLAQDKALLNLTLYHSGGSVSSTATLAAGQLFEWQDVVSEQLGLSAAAGAVEVESDMPLLITARTYNRVANGSYGQLLRGWLVEDALTPGREAVLTQLKRTANTRTNIGFVAFAAAETKDDSVPAGVLVQLRLLSDLGAQLSRTIEVSVPSPGWTQLNDVFAGITTAAGEGVCSLGYATVEVLTPGGAIWAYASLIDTGTGDPVTIPMVIMSQ